MIPDTPQPSPTEEKEEEEEQEQILLVDRPPQPKLSEEELSAAAPGDDRRNSGSGDDDDDADERRRADSEVIAPREEKEEEAAAERLRRHRVEMAGRVWIPEMWGQEAMLKDWIDSSVFDRFLVPKGLLSARDAMAVEGCRRPPQNAGHRRIENSCRR